MFFFKILFILPGLVSAIDCSTVPSFTATGFQEVKISAARFYWDQGSQKVKDICSKVIEVSVYDVRGREDEAFYCLKPKPKEVVTCLTTYLGEAAKTFIVPASWIRNGKNGKSLRSYRFHSYIQPDSDPSKYLDVFSRSLTSNLDNQNLILEGSKKSGNKSPTNEGFWFRLTFKK